jgi:hypothetical protein
LLEDEYNFVSDIIESGVDRLDAAQVNRMIEVYNRVFNENRKPTNCNSCFINSIFKPLKTLYGTYK